jgi:ubiquinone/menaquinone biosynthesis C-methylase UbiE
MSPSPSDSEARLAREIEHHRKIAARAEAIWNWESAAGRRRADRRAALFVEHGGLRPGKKVLELGCGTGVFLEKVAACGADIVGIDLSDELLARARTRLAGARNVTLDQGNAEDLPYPDGTFDAAYGSSILHHLDLAAALAAVHRVLKPGGRIVFAEPNAVNPQVVVMFRFEPTKEYFGVSPDEKAFTRFRARAALRAQGYVDVAVEPFDFLHPAVPAGWVGGMARVGEALEKVPLLREIAGSLLLRARKA